MNLLKKIVLFIFLIVSFSVKAQKIYSYIEVHSFNRTIEQLIILRDSAFIKLNENSLTPKFIETKIISTISVPVDTSEFLYPYEKTLMSFITGNYNSIMDEVIDNKDFHNARYLNKFHKQKKYKYLDIYGSDSLTYLVFNKVKRNATHLLNQIQSSTLSDDKKEFLALYLESIIHYNEFDIYPIDSLESQSSQYLAKYPNTEFNTYIVNRFIPNYKKSKIGFGAGFFSGYTLLTNNLLKTFTDGVPVGLNIDLSYYNIVLGINLSVSSTSIRNSFDYKEGIWASDMIPNIASGKIGIGYGIPIKKNFKLIPFAGISGINITASPNESNINLSEDESIQETVSVWKFPSAMAGISYEWKIRYLNSYDNLEESQLSQLKLKYWYLRFTLGYNNPQLGKLDNRFKGNVLFLNIGLGTFMNTVKK